jgi:hypothetical protein
MHVLPVLLSRVSLGKRSDQSSPLNAPARQNACHPQAKTYNRRDSQMVTHSSTSRPVQCLCMAERTGCPVFTDLWSYVLERLAISNIILIVPVACQTQAGITSVRPTCIPDFFRSGTYCSSDRKSRISLPIVCFDIYGPILPSKNNKVCLVVIVLSPGSEHELNGFTSIDYPNPRRIRGA